MESFYFFFGKLDFSSVIFCEIMQLPIYVRVYCSIQNNENDCRCTLLHPRHKINKRFYSFMKQTWHNNEDKSGNPDNDH